MFENLQIMSCTLCLEEEDVRKIHVHASDSLSIRESRIIYVYNIGYILCMNLRVYLIKARPHSFNPCDNFILLSLSLYSLHECHI